MNTKLKIFFTTLLSFFVITGLLNAQVTISISLDRNEITINDTAKLTISVNGSQQSVSPRLYGLNNFHVEQGGTTSRFNMVNGRVTQGLDNVLYLIPKNQGTFTLGPAEIDFNGKKIRSNQVKLTVRKTSNDVKHQSSDPIFVTASVSPKAGYPGQEFFYIIKFYYSVSVRDLSIELPDADNISLKQLGKPKEYSSVIKSKKYNVIEINYALFAEKPGKYTLNKSVMKMNVIEKRRDSFGFGFFDNFGRARPYAVSSNSVTLNIKNLPEENRPSDFSGLVGHFSIDSNLSPDHIKAGNSATLSVILKGQGNVTLMPDINLPDFENVKTYADQPVMDVKESNQGQSATKTMKWALVPQYEGDVIIPQLSISYFDPDKEKYEIAKTRPLTLNVSPGENQQNIPVVHKGDDIKSLKHEVKLFNRDILPIHDMPESLNIIKIDKMASWQIIILIIFPPFIFLCTLAFNKIKGIQNISAFAAKKALVQFNKSLKTIENEKQIPEMLKAFNIYLNKRIKLGGGHLTPDEAYEILLNKGAKQELAQNVKNTLFELEASVYTSSFGHSIEDLKQSLSKIAKQIDKGIKF